MSSLVPLALVRRIEYALLDQEICREEVEAGCAEAMRYDCYAVVVKPHYIEFARKCVKDSGIKVISVVGFPHGGSSTATKMYETQDLSQRGADEVAMVLNIGALRDGDDLLVRNDIATVVKTARGRPVTVMVESALIEDDDKVRACKIIDAAGATSLQVGTGMGRFSVDSEDLQLFRSSPRLHLKAAGRIDSLDRALEILEAGAMRIVASHFG